MDVNNNKDPLFDPVTGHYLEVTMNNAPRDRLPHKPENWLDNRLCQNNPIHSLFTYNHFPYSIASSSFQASIRQSRPIEAIQWALEMARADSDFNPNVKRGMGVTNVWTRLAVIAAEDVGLANPMMVVVLSQVLDKKYNNFDEEEMAILNATILMARSYKSRFLDWSCHVNITPDKPFDPANLNASLYLYHNKIIEHLKTGNHLQVIAYFKTLLHYAAYDKESKNKDPFPSAVFNALCQGVSFQNKKIKYYKNKGQLIWICLATVLRDIPFYQNVIKICEACYDLDHADRFRWKGESSLFTTCAIMAVCLRDQVEPRGLDLKLAPIEECFPGKQDLTQEQIQELRTRHQNGEIWYPVSEICKDKHTREGKTLGRGLQHFMELKMFLRHEDKDLKALNDFYLRYAILTNYSALPTFDKSGMTAQQYADWIPELRQRFERMVLIEK